MMYWNAPTSGQGGPCVFLDRDGVINERVVDGYVLDWADFRWRPESLKAMSLLSEAGARLIVASNQSCVGRGLLSRDGLTSIMEQMRAHLARRNIDLAAWYCCPHTPTDGCACRKPGIKMLLSGMRDLGCDIKHSYFIGDSESDFAAGNAAGCITYLVDPSTPGSLLSAAEDIVLREERR
jgi:histidinol-phosphate phosphatase family protein